MPFAWIEYLTLARYLQHHVNSAFTQEASLRSAISRAYYAAYCHSRNHARDHQGFIPSNKGDDHGRVRMHFQKRGDIMVAASLDRLRQWRNACDYDDTVSGLTPLLASAINAAQQIFRLL